MVMVELVQRLVILTWGTFTQAIQVYSPPVITEGKLRMLSESTMSPPGPLHMKVGVATKLSMTDAVQVMEDTCPQRSSLTGTPVNTSGGEVSEGQGEEVKYHYYRHSNFRFFSGEKSGILSKVQKKRNFF